jgi:cbb3-type cytochrome oxidase maturation protein
MIVIYLLIPLGIVTAAIFLAGFIWAVRSGQYEDTCTPALRPLIEDNPKNHKKANE